MKLEQLREVDHSSLEALEESFNAYFEEHPLEEAWFRFSDDEKSLIKRVWNAIKTRDIGALWDGSVEQLKKKQGVYQVDAFFKRESRKNIGKGLKLIQNLVVSIGIVTICVATAIGGSMVVAGGSLWAINMFMSVLAGGGSGAIASTLSTLGLGTLIAYLTAEYEWRLREFLTEDFHVIVAPELLKIYGNFGELKRMVIRTLRKVKRKIGRPGKSADKIKEYEPKSGWEQEYSRSGVIDYGLSS